MPNPRQIVGDDGVFTRGKYKGCHLANVPIPHLNRIAASNDTDIFIRNLIQWHIKGRMGGTAGEKPVRKV